MPDMLVNLLNLPEDPSLFQRLAEDGVRIFRALTPDQIGVTEWVRDQFGKHAAGECQAAFARQPAACILAARGRTPIGYACYDATYRNFFGPTAVLESERGKGVGKALLLTALRSMRDIGYAYAIIGGVGPAAFYEKTVGAILIPDLAPGVYRDFLQL